MTAQMATASQERVVTVKNGWLMLVVVILLLLCGIALVILSAVGAVSAANAEARGAEHGAHAGPLLLPLLTGIGCQILFAFLMPGFFTLQPNEARVLVLFGAYRGTVRTSGFHWGNPFYSRGGMMAVPKPDGSGMTMTLGRRYKVSLRARNLNGEKLKVNDKRGNPIEIAAVVVWKRAATRRRRCSTWTITKATCGSRASPPCGTWPAPTPTTTARARTNGHAAQRPGRGSAGAAEGAAGAAGQGRGRGRRGAADAPGVRAGDRAGACSAASRPRR